MDRSSPEALARAVTVRKRELRLNFILRSIKVGNIVCGFSSKRVVSNRGCFRMMSIENGRRKAIYIYVKIDII